MAYPDDVLYDSAIKTERDRWIKAIEKRLKEMEKSNYCLQDGCDPKACGYEKDPWCPYMEIKKLLEKKS